MLRDACVGEGLCFCFARFWCISCLNNLLWVCDRHLQDEVFGDLKQLRVISIGLQQEGQNIKTALWSFPSQLHADLVTQSKTQAEHKWDAFWISAALPHWLQNTLCLVYLSKFDISRISHYLSIRLFVTGVTNQLSVPHSKVMFAICPLRKYGDGRPATKQTENDNKNLSLLCIDHIYIWNFCSIHI